MQRVAVLLAAIVPLSAVSASTVERPARFDLATAFVNERVVLGKPQSEVTSLFGRPDAISRFRYATYFRYGSKRNYRLLVGFRRRGERIVATSMRFQSSHLVETRLGRVLALRPPAIQARVQSLYADVFRLTYEYQCRRGECIGFFSFARGRGGFAFGLARGRSFIRIALA